VFSRYFGSKIDFWVKKEHRFFSHINYQILGLTDNVLSFPFFYFWKKKARVGPFFMDQALGLTYQAHNA
jgi:hypothetical protein